MKRTLALTLALGALAGLSYATSLYLDDETTSTSTSSELELVHSLPPCPAEDSTTPCYWDAQARGNHHGQSFWVDAHAQVHYLES